jgi:hypothetical protein
MSGIDGYTKLLLHCNGEDSSTVFVDSSSSGHTVTAHGEAQIDTAQYKFGQSGLFDGTSDYLSTADSEDWDLGTGNFTIDCWVRFANTGANPTICARTTSSGNYFYLSWESGFLRFRDAGGSINFSAAFSISTNTWYHVAVSRSGNDFRIFKNGVQIGTTYTNSASMLARSVGLDVGAMTMSANYEMNGWIDEFRWSKGIARWTSNFTPPTEEYSYPTEEVDINESFNLSDDWQISTNPEQGSIEDTFALSDNWIIQSNPEQESINDFFNLADNWNISTIEYTHFASKIISYNPLIYVTNANPAKIVKVDITDPENPIKYTFTIIGNSYAKDVIVNSENDFFYVICANGKIVKININDLDDQLIIDTLDLNNLLNVSAINSSFLTFASTDDSSGEIIMLDEREVNKINVDLRWTEQIRKIISIRLDSILGKLVNLDLRWKAVISKIVGVDLRWLVQSYNDINKYPISYTDWQLYIDGTELTSIDDVDMNSILINHDITREEKKASTAQFVLNRKHDNLNYANTGTSSQITNNNVVIIKIKGITEFTGKIASLTCNSETETVNVVAIGTRPADKRHFINIPLAGINEPLHLYHCLINNVQIDNPYIDIDDENPEYYKGIRVDLGTRIEQNIIRWRLISSLGTTGLAEEIEKGEFQAEQGWTYFWLASFKNFVTGIQNGLLQYVGTSLGSLSTDTWELLGCTYWEQREMADIESEMGFYQVGSAPYNEISVQNGKKITHYRWVDKTDGLWSIKDEGYNYTDYVKRVADLEYQKLLNINGDILPRTSGEISLSIDAYYYYNIGLLTRINLTNTTASNIYNCQNGFPVSVKTIQIKCSREGENSMIVSLSCDNLKSQLELEEIDAMYPDVNSDEFTTRAISHRQFPKFDPNTWGYVV